MWTEIEREGHLRFIFSIHLSQTFFDWMKNFSDPLVAIRFHFTSFTDQKTHVDVISGASAKDPFTFIQNGRFLTEKIDSLTLKDERIKFKKRALLEKFSAQV